MSTDLMLSITAENVETKMNLIAEEQHRVKALHIWISGWVSLETKDTHLPHVKRSQMCCLSSSCSATCQLLIPSLVSAEVFPGVSAVSLHLLHPEGNPEELCGLKMEIEDLALSMLHQVSPPLSQIQKGLIAAETQ